MLSLVLPLVLIALAAVLYRYLRRKPDSRALWRSSLAIGLTIGVTRALLASVGWYAVEHTGGAGQVPGYLLAMFAWPEAAVFGQQRGVAPLSFYVLLGALLIASSVMVLAAVAFAVQVSRRKLDA